jgi:peptidoglycan/xylan/chitin deacetylase (PgdA/CDA1 family)
MEARRSNFARRLLDQIPNKREFLARSFERLGLLSLLERLARRQQPRLVVLTYHRITTPGAEAGSFYDSVISATPESFRAQVRFLANRYRIIGLDQVCEIEIRGSVDSQEPAILITFDDGYRDNFETAFPILHELGVPAVFFIPTGVLNVPRLPWWDHVAYAVKQTHVMQLRLDRFPGDPKTMIIDLSMNPDARKRSSAIMQIISQFLDRAIPDEAWFLANLDERAEVTIDSGALGRGLFMSWDQVQQLTDAGMAIGSHGHSHHALGGLDDDAQRCELADSKRILESRLGRDVTAVAYPFGWVGTFTPRTVSLATEVGYRLGFSSIEGVNQLNRSGFEPLALRRLNVGAGDTPPLLRARISLHTVHGKSFL